MAEQQQPGLDFIAAQLRTPSGDFANKIADAMDEANERLFDLTFQSMDVQDGQEILEIGFGSGKFVPRLLAAAGNLSLKGLELSEEMVELAKVNNPDAVASGAFEPVAGSSDNMPFQDDSFDKVYCNMVIFFWDDPAVHLSEVRRVLKPGGTFYSGFRPKSSMEQMPFTQYGFNLYEVDEWQDVLTANGLLHVATHKSLDLTQTILGHQVQLESVCIESQK